MDVASLIAAARGMVRDDWTIAQVRARGDDGSYLVQVSGRGCDIPVKSAADEDASAGDNVLLSIVSGCHTIVALSPYRTCSYVVPVTHEDGSDLKWLDVDGADAGAAAVPNVAANLTAAHARIHAMLSSADHTDVAETAAEGDLLMWDGAVWVPMTIEIVLDGGTY